MVVWLSHKNADKVPEQGLIREEAVVEELDHAWNHCLVHQLELHPPLQPFAVRIHLELQL